MPSEAKIIILCEFMFKLYFANHVQTQTLFYPHNFRSKEDSGCRTRLSAHSYRSFAISIRQLNFPGYFMGKVVNVVECNWSHFLNQSLELFIEYIV